MARARRGGTLPGFAFGTQLHWVACPAASIRVHADAAFAAAAAHSLQAVCVSPSRRLTPTYHPRFSPSTNSPPYTHLHTPHAHTQHAQPASYDAPPGFNIYAALAWRCKPHAKRAGHIKAVAGNHSLDFRWAPCSTTTTTTTTSSLPFKQRFWALPPPRRQTRRRRWTGQ